MTYSETSARIETLFKELICLQLFKSWNLFATRMFYFAAPGFQNQEDDGDFRLTLECPWRIEYQDLVLVGSEDYGIRSDDNSDPAWNPTDMQWGHLQDQRLVELLGMERNGAIFNIGSNLVVESVATDDLGGFRLHLSGGYTLSVFPAGSVDLQWLLSRKAGGNLALKGGDLS